MATKVDVDAERVLFSRNGREQSVHRTHIISVFDEPDTGLWWRPFKSSTSFGAAVGASVPVFAALPTLFANGPIWVVILMSLLATALVVNLVFHASLFLTKRPTHQVVLDTTRGPVTIAGPVSAGDAVRLADDLHGQLFPSRPVDRDGRVRVEVGSGEDQLAREDDATNTAARERPRRKAS